MFDRISHIGALLAACACASCIGNIGDRAGDAEPNDNPLSCGQAGSIHPGRAPLRRLTRFEYSSTVRDLLGDTTEPANAFPSEEIGNGFGNDADAQPVSSLLAEKYNAVAEAVSLRATSTPELLANLAPCAADVDEATDPATEQSCVRDVIESFVTRAYRRPLLEEEVDELLALSQSIREEASFTTSIAALIEAVLQSPDFLYRVEWGSDDAVKVRRPSGWEMATRLSYFLWGTLPDDELRGAAAAGELESDEGVLAQATRMLDDERARPVIRFFFDNLLPISNLSGLERDAEIYPTFTGAIGALMREETQRFLEYEIFEGSGTWFGALTAPYTFVNQPLAEFYGMSGVSGEAFQKVDLDTDKRLGLLTQAGVVAGPIHSNMTNPVVRGSFIVQKMMCIQIPLPTGDILAKVKPPNPDSGDTARERYSAHSQDPVCATCHQMMDPVGLALENYDAVGLWRDTENGVTIDASGSVPDMPGTTNGPVELVRKIAEAEATHACFTSHWMNFAYGRTLDGDDQCTQARVETAFVDSGHDIKKLLLSLTQTDAFLYLPARED